MKTYKPIACHLHDHIEHFATLRKKVMIQYLDNQGSEQSVESIIVDWVNTGEGEYVVLKDNNMRIRFDFLLRVGEIDFRDADSCSV